MNAIEYKNISMAYGEKEIVHNLNLTVEQGEFVTIIGSSGCGKTTILKMVNGLLAPTAGEIFVEGKSTKELDLTELRRNIGYAIQGSVLSVSYTHLDVYKRQTIQIPQPVFRYQNSRSRRLHIPNRPLQPANPWKIQIGGRLIQHHDTRLCSPDATTGNLLLFSARKRKNIAVQ